MAMVSYSRISICWPVSGVKTAAKEETLKVACHPNASRPGRLRSDIWSSSGYHETLTLFPPAFPSTLSSLPFTGHLGTNVYVTLLLLDPEGPSRVGGYEGGGGEPFVNPFSTSS